MKKALAVLRSLLLLGVLLLGVLLLGLGLMRARQWYLHRRAC